MTVTIDADNAILGRLASTAAQELKDGEEVHIVNAEQAVVSGERDDIYEKYRGKRNAGTKESGPRFPKAPERIVKRTVRGMLPNGPDGREAFKRLRTYRGNPEDRDADDITVKTGDELRHREYVTVEDISNHI